MNPTTSKGTLIDHVYDNRPTNDIVVQVHDTCYSDHDTVYCSIPIYADTCIVPAITNMQENVEVCNQYQAILIRNVQYLYYS